MVSLPGVCREVKEFQVIWKERKATEKIIKVFRAISPYLLFLSEILAKFMSAMEHFALPLGQKRRDGHLIRFVSVKAAHQDILRRRVAVHVMPHRSQIV